MMFDQRVLFSDNGTIEDISLQVNDFRTDSYTMNFVSAEDAIYIGTSLPFNHKFFELESVNANASDIQISIWDGQVFNSVADIQDSSRSGSASLANSNIIRFTPDREKVWTRELDSFDVSGLEMTKIYQMYWLKIGFSADLSAGVQIKYIGQKFCTDSDIYDYYPDLNQTNLKLSFEAGKTTWDEQAFIATEIIGRDLKRRFSLLNSNQIIDYELFREAAIHKSAELIYHGLGQSYYEVRNSCRDHYLKALELGYLRLDQDKDGLLSDKERQLKQGYFKR